MRRAALSLAAALAISALLTSCSGVSMAQTRPPPTRPITDIAREEPAEVVTVNDTRLDLSTGRGGRGLTAHAPAVGVGPIGLRVPVTVGGEKKMDVPAEEITVRLKDGRMISTVQELSSPPFAPGEKVRVIYEKTEDGSKGRMQIVR